MQLDLKPLETFLSEDISPTALSKLFDELLYDYITMLVKIQLSDAKNITVHESAGLFIFYLKLLRDILPECQRQNN